MRGGCGNLLKMPHQRVKPFRRSAVRQMRSEPIEPIEVEEALSWRLRPVADSAA